MHHRPRQRPPLVLVPGIQGRWEYMRPAVDALARAFRVITFSLCDEPRPATVRPATRLRQLRRAGRRGARQSGIERATICGVSFGGLIALRFAARHPDRVRRAGPGVDAGPALAPAAASSRSTLRAAVALRPAVPRRVAVAAAARDRSRHSRRRRARRRFALAAAHAVCARRCRSRGWPRARG